MHDAELEQVIGPGLEPTDEFVSGLRERMSVEWRTKPLAAARHRSVRVAAGVAVSLALLIGAMVWLGRESKQTVASPVATTITAPNDLQRVATIMFSEPTDAWATASESATFDYLEYFDTPGRHVLYQRDGAWFVGYFDLNGLVAAMPVDKVPDGDEYWVTWTLQPEDNELLVVDGYPYRQVSGEWVQVGEPIMGSRLAPPSVDEARSTAQSWVITYPGEEWTVPKPFDWDGRPPMLSIVHSQTIGGYEVAMGTHTPTESVFWLLGADGRVTGARLPGPWTLLNADDERLELGAIDPTRHDYSVVRVDWSTILD
jgi:hypothetical protein